MTVPERKKSRATPGGNQLSRVAQVLVAAIRKAHLQFPAAEGIADIGALHKPLSSIQTGDLFHTHRFRWLDKAALKDGGPGTKWRLCTVSAVEEVKCLLGIFPIWMTGMVYNVTVAQLSTVFSEQGNIMRQPGWITIPPTSMQAFNIAANILFGMLYDVVVTRLGHTKGITKLQRMGVGLLMALASMVAAAAMETIRLSFHNLDIDISIFWLVPQYVLVGISQVFMVVAQMEFFYSEVSPGMRSLGSCLPLLARAFGNYVSTFMVDIVMSITTRNGSAGWISEDLNEGHLDYFYWMVAAIMMADFLVFLGFARSYTYLDTPDDEKKSSNDLVVNLS